MDQSTPPAPEILAHSLLAFWADAGVDCLYQDEATDRIAAGLSPPPRRVEHVAAPLRTAPAAGEPASDALAEARRLAAAAQDLTSLAEAIAGFEGCPLRFEGAATRSVFSRGPSDAPVMIIGEGPGGDEDARGEPFVGRAGQLLDRMLAAAGLSDRVFITNTVFWRPPGNRTPSLSEQALCAPFVERAISLVRPKMLLLVGGASAKAMLKREEGILAMRGRWFEWRSDDESLELPAMPTLHPAFLLRQPAAKKKAWSDLVSLVQRLDRPDRPH
ncbi:uracil-DNA glycosylase [Phenylobacterium sp.]|uniref:uracil-DNA glycosylase n=1 Tax=Phenylobacterium sp. TaxID=1871053 RepID=UPI00273019E9|nr:uracil-DNA glycosylase [Phenylobacterium sp.]MDP1875718.1 uracil-DNA glycosylase [Phenylobacterium sp.]MDP3491458.1 uracil-DNA glycosylase [Phenylobacterium sp.]